MRYFLFSYFQLTFLRVAFWAASSSTSGLSRITPTAGSLALGTSGTLTAGSVNVSAGTLSLASSSSLSATGSITVGTPAGYSNGFSNNSATGTVTNTVTRAAATVPPPSTGVQLP